MIIYINTQKIKYIVLVLFVVQRLVIKVVETVKIIKGLLTTRNLIWLNRCQWMRKWKNMTDIKSIEEQKIDFLKKLWYNIYVIKNKKSILGSRSKARTADSKPANVSSILTSPAIRHLQQILILFNAKFGN